MICPRFKRGFCRALALFLLVLNLNSCANDPEFSDLSKSDYREKHRPQFHFSPASNWMNDPNGMVYLDGEYHLFYQYYPDSNVWGPMHWGHAVSTDLVQWEHLPIGLYPDSIGMIISGSAVYDRENTSGLGIENEGPLVAIFTHHNPVLERTDAPNFQNQSIAYSNDKGRTWTKYKGNPVIKNPGIRDFRDPKVIWHEKSQQWIMSVAALDHIKFYSSPDLIDWTYESDFGQTVGSHDGVWECPDLFPLTSTSGKAYWVLLQNMNPGNPNGGSGIQYFIGQFDGKRFEIDPKFKTLLATKSKSIPEGILFEDFENGYEKWTVIGSAFEEIKTVGKSNLTGKRGKALANSARGGDHKTGELISPTFTITSDYINFKIGGGNHRGRTLLALEIDGRHVREAEGRNSDHLDWRGWNVSAYRGAQARIKIIDKHAGKWGRIYVDHIVFADNLAHGEISGSVWLDAGRDNYAGVTWDNAPHTEYERIFIGWMSNWAYAQVVPTRPWRSAMTLPWKLQLKEIDGIPRLIGYPNISDELYANDKIYLFHDSTVLPQSGLAHIRLDATTENSVNPMSIELRNESGEFIVFTYHPKTQDLLLDRRQSGNITFSKDFPSISRTKRIMRDVPISLDIFVDRASVEIFIDNGVNIFTEIFFPTTPYTHVVISSGNGSIQEIRRIW